MPKFGSIRTYDYYFGAQFGPEPEYWGSLMVFLQPTAPVGWTQSITYTDYALRVTNGTISQAGTVNFSTIHNTATTITTTPGSIQTITLSPIEFTDGTYLPSHLHSYTYTAVGAGLYAYLSGGIGPSPVYPTKISITAAVQSTGAWNPVLQNNWPAGLTTATTPAPFNAPVSHSHSVNVPVTATFGPINMSLKYVDAIIATKNSS